MNISENTINKIELDYTIWFEDDYTNEVSPQKATYINIGFERGEPNIFIGKSFKAPKKMEVTYEWVAKKINRKKELVNFCKNFNTFLKKHGLRGYPTSYGIGVETIYKMTGNFDQICALIEKKLNSFGIKYKTEYSDAHWVFRYKISQSAENIEKLNKQPQEA